MYIIRKIVKRGKQKIKLTPQEIEEAYNEYKSQKKENEKDRNYFLSFSY